MTWEKGMHGMGDGMHENWLRAGRAGGARAAGALVVPAVGACHCAERFCVLAHPASQPASQPSFLVTLPEGAKQPSNRATLPTLSASLGSARAASPGSCITSISRSLLAHTIRCRHRSHFPAVFRQICLREFYYCFGSAGY